MSIIVLSDPLIGSHDVVARLYAASIEALGEPVSVEPLAEGTSRGRRARVAIHVTVGPRFETLPGVRNVAVVHHEWSRYPRSWVDRLEAFDEVWVTSDHSAEVLRASGLRGDVEVVPPALDLEPVQQKTTWEAHRPFRFVACGDAHFRKGYHLLIEAFDLAFPRVGDATLTIKTSPDCPWTSARPDVTFVTERLTPAALNTLYRESDVLVSASLGEGLGLPLAEAMLVGLPVAANRWGGHRSLLTTGGAFEIPHRVVDQVFASTPAHYAPGQQCALSDPPAIAAVLRGAVRSSSGQRRVMAGTARDGLLARYGRAATLARLRERLRCGKAA